MSTQSLAKRSMAVVPETIAPDLLNKLVTSGDLKGLTPDQQRAYYIYRCKLLDLDPATQPFDLINLQGKLTLYAKKECASQLSSKRGLSATIVTQGIQGDLYVVQARCKGGDGRETDDLGAVSIKGKSGDDLCNAMMKAATKAKRRAILTHCGLGMLDESELETVRRNGWRDSGSEEEAKAVADAKLAQYTEGFAARSTLEQQEALGPPQTTTQAPSVAPEPTSRDSGASPRPAADPRAGRYLYESQAADMKEFTRLKRSVGEEAYRRVLAHHGVPKSNYFNTHEAASTCISDLLETEKAQAKQKRLEKQKADAEMDAASLLPCRPGSGCPTNISNAFAQIQAKAKLPLEEMNRGLKDSFEIYRSKFPDASPEDAWTAILVTLQDKMDHRGSK